MKNEKEVQKKIDALIKERDALKKANDTVDANTQKAVHKLHIVQGKENAKFEAKVAKINANIDKLAAKLKPAEPVEADAPETPAKKRK